MLKSLRLIASSVLASASAVLAHLLYVLLAQVLGWANRISKAADTPYTELYALQTANWFQRLRLLFQLIVPSPFRKGTFHESTFGPSRNVQILPEHYWIYINGICTDEYLAAQSQIQLEHTFQAPIDLLHNPCNTLLNDLLECAFDRHFLTPHQVTKLLYEKVVDQLVNSNRTKVVLLCHTRGSIVAANMLKMFQKDVSEDRLKVSDLAKLEIIAIANCSTQMHYVEAPQVDKWLASTDGADASTVEHKTRARRASKDITDSEAHSDEHEQLLASHDEHDVAHEGSRRKGAHSKHNKQNQHEESADHEEVQRETAEEHTESKPKNRKGQAKREPTEDADNNENLHPNMPAEDQQQKSSKRGNRGRANSRLKGKHLASASEDVQEGDDHEVARNRSGSMQSQHDDADEGHADFKPRGRKHHKAKKHDDSHEEHHDEAQQLPAITGPKKLPAIAGPEVFPAIAGPEQLLAIEGPEEVLALPVPPNMMLPALPAPPVKKETPKHKPAKAHAPETSAHPVMMLGSVISELKQLQSESTEEFRDTHGTGSRKHSVDHTEQEHAAPELTGQKHALPGAGEMGVKRKHRKRQPAQENPVAMFGSVIDELEHVLEEAADEQFGSQSGFKGHSTLHSSSGEAKSSQPRPVKESRSVKRKHKKQQHSSQENPVVVFGSVIDELQQVLEEAAQQEFGVQGGVHKQPTVSSSTGVPDLQQTAAPLQESRSAKRKHKKQAKKAAAEANPVAMFGSVIDELEHVLEEAAQEEFGDAKGTQSLNKQPSVPQAVHQSKPSSQKTAPTTAAKPASKQAQPQQPLPDQTVAMFAPVIEELEQVLQDPEHQPHTPDDARDGTEHALKHEQKHEQKHELKQETIKITGDSSELDTLLSEAADALFGAKGETKDKEPSKEATHHKQSAVGGMSYAAIAALPPTEEALDNVVDTNDLMINAEFVPLPSIPADTLMQGDDKHHEHLSAVGPADGNDAREKVAALPAEEDEAEALHVKSLAVVETFGGEMTFAEMAALPPTEEALDEVVETNDIMINAEFVPLPSVPADATSAELKHAEHLDAVGPSDGGDASAKVAVMSPPAPVEDSQAKRLHKHDSEVPPNSLVDFPPLPDLSSESLDHEHLASVEASGGEIDDAEFPPLESVQHSDNEDMELPKREAAGKHSNIHVNLHGHKHHADTGIALDTVEPHKATPGLLNPVLNELKQLQAQAGPQQKRSAAMLAELQHHQHLDQHEVPAKKNPSAGATKAHHADTSSKLFQRAVADVRPSASQSDKPSLSQHRPAQKNAQEPRKAAPLKRGAEDEYSDSDVADLFEKDQPQAPQPKLPAPRTNSAPKQRPHHTTPEHYNVMLALMQRIPQLDADDKDETQPEAKEHGDEKKRTETKQHERDVPKKQKAELQAAALSGMGTISTSHQTIPMPLPEKVIVKPHADAQHDTETEHADVHGETKRKRSPRHADKHKHQEELPPAVLESIGAAPATQPSFPMTVSKELFTAPHAEVQRNTEVEHADAQGETRRKRSPRHADKQKHRDEHDAADSQEKQQQETAPKEHSEAAKPAQGARSESAKRKKPQHVITSQSASADSHDDAVNFFDKQRSPTSIASRKARSKGQDKTQEKSLDTVHEKPQVKTHEKLQTEEKAEQNTQVDTHDSKAHHKPERKERERAASRGQTRDVPKGPVPYIESIGNRYDFFARLGMLSPLPVIQQKVQGPRFVNDDAFGHLLGACYLNGFRREAFGYRNVSMDADAPVSKLLQYLP
jgi:hypothetical protein